MAISVVILAAGEGSRMNTPRTPKALHEVAHASLLAHALMGAATLNPERVIVVTGHHSKEVSDAVGGLNDKWNAVETGERWNFTAATVEQAERRGTAHAVDQTRAALADFEGDLLVLYADTPFIAPETFQRMAKARADGADLVLLGFTPEDPARYGRLVMSDDDRLERIVEFGDADENERAIRLCNSGVLLADRRLMFDLIADVNKDNAAREYFLTQLPELANKRGLTTRVVICGEDEALGVNTLGDLARAEAVFQSGVRARMLGRGVIMRAPETVYFAFDTKIGSDARIEPYVTFGPGVVVGENVEIRSFSYMKNCLVSSGVRLGPFTRLRTGAKLSEGARLGNFVEVKNSALAEDARVDHLSYVGDAEVGAGTTIGAGTIIANYDGAFKHRTRIGADALIGSNTVIVAPRKIGDHAMTAAGSAITKDVGNGALALGRARQVEKPGLARQLMDKIRAAKKMRNG